MKDQGRQKLARVYFEDEPGAANRAAKLLNARGGAADASAFCATEKRERPQDASVRQTPNNLKRELEFGRHVAVGWQVAVDFETDADFNQDRCGPRHAFLL